MFLFPIFLKVNGFSVQELACRILEKALDKNASIAICGPVGTGKTVLLEHLALHLKLKGCRLVRFDFGELAAYEGGKPDYIVADHLASLQSLETIKKDYAGIPLIAVLYEYPDSGFDVIVKVLPQL